jgi:hypothetical protein
MAAQQSTSGGSPGNPTIIELAPDVVSVAPDFGTGGVQFEVFDSNANTAFRTLFDVGDALDAALRLVGAAIRLRRLMTP